MKLLVLVIHEQLKQEAADIFRGLEQIQGFTFSDVEGHGARSGGNRFLSARDKVVGYTPHVRVDLLLEDEAVAPTLAALKETDLARDEQTLYWVTNVEQHGRL